MKLIKVDTGLYRTEDDKFEVEKDWTSANGGTKLVSCYSIKKSKRDYKTVKTLSEAKEVINLYYS